MRPRLQIEPQAIVEPWLAVRLRQDREAAARQAVENLLQLG
jgi:hypothetical protein